MPDINWLAAFVGAIAAFAVGALWYSPLLFAKPWQKELGLSDGEIDNGSFAKVLIMAFALIFLAAIVMSLLVRGPASIGYGLSYGFHVGLFFVSTMIGVNYVFERRSLKLWLINAGYATLVFTIIGGVLGAFS